MADNEQQDDYLSNMLNALNEKEQRASLIMIQRQLQGRLKRSLMLRMLLKRLMSRSVKLMQTLS
ncbi:MAG: hypothetical protein ACLS9K_10440 [Lachnospira eligens]